MLFTSAFYLGAAGFDGRCGGEAELEGDTALGGRDVLPSTLGAVIDLIGRVETKSVARSA